MSNAGTQEVLAGLGSLLSGHGHDGVPLRASWAQLASTPILTARAVLAAAA
ncbi:MAG: hypothetical protein N2512_12045 [Armatimonadetes bacterium]|nr:hypothetical protein [Armatimonadota bacterium]